VIKARVNETAVLPCTVRGMADVLFHWSRNDFVVWKLKRFQSIKNVHMKIQNVQLTDAGNYSCHAWNTFGKDVARRILVVDGIGKSQHTKAPPAMKKELPVDVPVNLPGPLLPIFRSPTLAPSETRTRTGYVNEEVKLKCPIPIPGKSFRSFTFEWFKEGIPIKTVKPRILLKGGKRKLLLKQLIESDAGNYTCRIKRKNKPVDSRETTFRLKIRQVRPTVLVSKVK
jgi:hypothetical protein